jgi:hypothetical protein
MKRIALGLAGCFAMRIASAGIYVELVENDTRTGSTSLLQKMYVQGGSGRFVDDGGRSSLIKGDTMYIIDESDKSYIVFDKATMEQLAAKIKALREQMKEQIATLPPDQRAQMEQQLGGEEGATAFTIDAVDTGKSDKVEGRACKVWDIKRNGELDDQYCVVDFAQLPGKENLQAVFASFAKVFEEMAKSVPMLAGVMTNEFGALSKVHGYPMRIRQYERGKLDSIEQVVKVWREEAIPASMFEIPAGYTRKTMPQE